MAWFKLYQTRARHPKTLRLASLMKKERRYVCGFLDDFWTWGIDVATVEGRLSGLSADDIADAMDFPRQKGKWLMDCLVRSGYVDVADNGDYVLHDWAEYAGALNESRARDADRKRKDRGCPPDVRRMSAGQSADKPRTESGCPAFVHAQDKDLDKERDRDKDTGIGNAPIAPKGGETDGGAKPESAQNMRFSEFWAMYPKKQGKGAAEKAYAKAKPDRDTHMAILKAVTLQKQSSQWRRDNGQYIPNPATWINQRRWEDEIQTGGPTDGKGRPDVDYGTSVDANGVERTRGGMRVANPEEW